MLEKQELTSPERPKKGTERTGKGDGEDGRTGRKGRVSEEKGDGEDGPILMGCGEDVAS